MGKDNPLSLYHRERLVACKDNNWLLTTKQLDVIREHFDILDIEKSGFINENEFINLAKVLGEELQEPDIEDAMREINLNEDGKISFDEFIAWWQADEDDASFYSEHSNSDDDTDIENLREERLEQARAAAKIQALTRGRAERFMHEIRIKFKTDSQESANFLARFYRGRIARRKFRSILLNLWREEKLTERSAAVKIQSLFRGNYARYRAINISSTRMQPPEECYICEVCPGEEKLFFPKAPLGTRAPWQPCTDMRPGGTFGIHGSVTKFSISLQYVFDANLSAEDTRRRNLGLQGAVDDCEDDADDGKPKGAAPTSYLALPKGTLQLYRFGQRVGKFLSKHITTSVCLYSDSGKLLEIITDPLVSKTGAVVYLPPKLYHWKQNEEIFFRLRKIPKECSFILYTLNLSSKLDLTEFRKISLTAWVNDPAVPGTKGIENLSAGGGSELFRFPLTKHTYPDIFEGKHLVLLMMSKNGAFWKVQCLGDSCTLKEEVKIKNQVHEKVRSRIKDKSRNTNETNKGNKINKNKIDERDDANESLNEAIRLEEWEPMNANEIAETDEVKAILWRTPTVAPRVREITIWVKAGKGLAPKDLNKKSDPYYTITWGSGKKADRFYQSSVVRCSLNPSWNDPPFVVKYAIESDPREIIVTCWDYDLGSDNDFMGVVRVPTAVIFQLGLGIHERWINLETWPEIHSKPEDLNVKGAIHFAFKVKHATGYEEFNKEREEVLAKEEAEWKEMQNQKKTNKKVRK